MRPSIYTHFVDDEEVEVQPKNLPVLKPPFVLSDQEFEEVCRRQERIRSKLGNSAVKFQHNPQDQVKLQMAMLYEFFGQKHYESQLQKASAADLRKHFEKKLGRSGYKGMSGMLKSLAHSSDFKKSSYLSDKLKSFYKSGGGFDHLGLSVQSAEIISERSAAASPKSSPKVRSTSFRMARDCPSPKSSALSPTGDSKKSETPWSNFEQKMRQQLRNIQACEEESDFLFLQNSQIMHQSKAHHDKRQQQKRGQDALPNYDYVQSSRYGFADIHQVALGEAGVHHASVEQGHPLNTEVLRPNRHLFNHRLHQAQKKQRHQASRHLMSTELAPVSEKKSDKSRNPLFSRTQLNQPSINVTGYLNTQRFKTPGGALPKKAPFKTRNDPTSTMSKSLYMQRPENSMFSLKSVKFSEDKKILTHVSTDQNKILIHESNNRPSDFERGSPDYQSSPKDLTGKTPPGFATKPFAEGPLFEVEERSPRFSPIDQITWKEREKEVLDSPISTDLNSKMNSTRINFGPPPTVLSSNVIAYKNLIKQLRSKKKNQMSPEQAKAYVKKNYFRNSPGRRPPQTTSGRYTSQEHHRPLNLYPAIRERVSQLKQKQPLLLEGNQSQKVDTRESIEFLSETAKPLKQLQIPSEEALDTSNSLATPFNVPESKTPENEDYFPQQRGDNLFASSQSKLSSTAHFRKATEINSKLLSMPTTLIAKELEMPQMKIGRKADNLSMYRNQRNMKTSHLSSRPNNLSLSQPLFSQPHRHRPKMAKTGANFRPLKNYNRDSQQTFQRLVPPAEVLSSYSKLNLTQEGFSARVDTGTDKKEGQPLSALLLGLLKNSSASSMSPSTSASRARK